MVDVIYRQVGFFNDVLHGFYCFLVLPEDLLKLAHLLSKLLLVLCLLKVESEKLLIHAFDCIKVRR